MSESIFDLMAPHIPEDHAHQSNAVTELQAVIDLGHDARSVLDLGCGDGRSADLFRRVAPDCEWIGVDIEESPEVGARVRDDVTFVTYDGENLPFDSDTFDLVYSYQVMEHVRHPERVLKEVKRVLRPGGLFVGQTSQFEPYHSYSMWNFTIYGFKVLIESVGMSLSKIRPSIDGITLIERSYLGRPKEYSKWFGQESPLNQEIERVCNEKARSIRVKNFRKLMYCGQFTFVCEA